MPLKTERIPARRIHEHLGGIEQAEAKLKKQADKVRQQLQALRAARKILGREVGSGGNRWQEETGWQEKRKCLPPQERRLGKQQRAVGKVPGSEGEGNTKPLILHRASLRIRSCTLVRISESKQTNHIERDAVLSLKKQCGKHNNGHRENIRRPTESAHRDALYKHVLWVCLGGNTFERRTSGNFNPGSVAGPRCQTY